MSLKINQHHLLVIIRGILAILFGILALFYPEITLYALALAFGAFTLIGGTFLVIISLQNRRFTRLWSYWLFEGIVDLVIGLLVLLNPGISVSFFLVIMGLWAILGGIILVLLFNRLRRQTSKRHGILVVGIFSILFGIVLLLNPFRSAMVLAMIIGFFAIVYGAISIINSGKMKLVDIY